MYLKPLSHIFEVDRLAASRHWLVKEIQLTGHDMRVSGKWFKKWQDCKWRQQQLAFNHNDGENFGFIFFCFCISSDMSGEDECIPYSARVRDNWNFLVLYNTRHKCCTTALSKRVCTCTWITPTHVCIRTACTHATYVVKLECTETVHFVLGNLKTTLTLYPHFEMTCASLMCVNLRGATLDVWKISLDNQPELIVENLGEGGGRTWLWYSYFDGVQAH